MIAPAPLLALLALLPAAANPALLARGESLTATLCNGGTISVPVGDQPLPGQSTACCNKGCHSGEKRKRAGQETPARK